MEKGSSGLCCICLEKKHQYTCPRCNVRYCSLACYKHNKHADCSELFYRDWFIKEMKERKIADEEKQAILETIQRVEDENPIVDFLDEEVPLEERLSNIDVNKICEENVDEVWEKLTRDEQEEFKKLASSGFLSVSEELRKPWTPWWIAHEPALVQEVGSGGDKSNDFDLPPVLQVPSFNSLAAGRSPSPMIGFNVVNALYSYAFFQRLFNGDGTKEFLSDFCEFSVFSSDVLRESRTFVSADASLCAGMQGCVETAKQQAFTFDMQFSIECLQDVSHILMGPSLRSSSKYVACVLSDMHATLKKYHKLLKTNSDAGKSLLGDGSSLRKRLFAIMKKVEFLLSWSSSFREQLTLLSIEVSELYKNKLQSFKNDIAMEHAVTVNLNKHTEVTKTQFKSKIVELN